MPLDPLDHETLYTFTLHAPSGAEIEAEELRATVERAGFGVEVGAAAAAAGQARVFGDAPRVSSQSFAFSAEPVDPSEPVLVTLAPADMTAGMPAELAVSMGVTVVGAFAFHEYAAASLSTVDVHVWSTNEDRVLPVLARVGELARELGLIIHDDRIDVLEDDEFERDSDSDTDSDSGGAYDPVASDLAEYAPAHPVLLVELWRAHREDLLDANAIDERDGSVDPARVIGLTQQTFATPDGAELLAVSVRGNRTALLLGPEYETAERMFIDGVEVDLPAGAWTDIHLVGHRGHLLIGSADWVDTDDDELAVAVYAAPGELQSSFGIVGGGEVTVAQSHVVIGFSDESIHGGDDLAQNGVIAYDFSGELTLAYQRDFGSDAVDVADCYALVHVDQDVVACYPYDEFPIVLLDLATNTQRVIDTPAPRGFRALTIVGDVAWLHGAYSTNAVFRPDLATGVIEGVAMTPSVLLLTGISGGRFLAAGSHGYT
ncbi:MAG: hypothetical protein H7287_09980, partial [Thermoleophilia bacterium]|nr:hypothetical protein [Thermoleophilia bacterium]